MVQWHEVPVNEPILDPLTSLAGLVVKGEDLRATLDEVATATTLTSNHYLVLVNGNVTITLPKAANHKERIYTIKNIGEGRVTIEPYSGEKIEWDTNLVLGLQGDFVTLTTKGEQVNNSDWFITGGRNVKSEDLLKEIRDSLSSPLDKLIYIMARMEKMLDDSTDTEVEKHEVEKELKNLEVEIR